MWLLSVLLAVSVSVTICENQNKASRYISVISRCAGCSRLAAQLADNHSELVVFGNIEGPRFIIQDGSLCPSNFGMVDMDHVRFVDQNHRFVLLPLVCLCLFSICVFLSVFSEKLRFGNGWVLRKGSQYRDIASTHQLITQIPILRDFVLEIPSVADTKAKNSVVQERDVGALTSEDYYDKIKAFSVALNKHKVVLKFENYNIELRSGDPETNLFGLHWIWTYRIVVETMNEIYRTRMSMTKAMELMVFGFDLLGCQLYEFRNGTPVSVAEYFTCASAKEDVQQHMDAIMRNHEQEGGLILDVESFGELSMLQALVRTKTREFELVCVRASKMFLLRENEKVSLAIISILLSQYYCIQMADQTATMKRYQKCEDLMKAMHSSMVVFDDAGRKTLEVGDRENFEYISEQELLGCQGERDFLILNGSLHVSRGMVQEPDNHLYYIDRSEISVDPQYQDALTFARVTNLHLLDRSMTWEPNEEWSIDPVAVGSISKCARVMLPLGKSVCLYRFSNAESERCDNCIIELDRQAAELGGEVVIKEVEQNNDFGIWLVDCEKREVVWEMTTRQTDHQIESLNGKPMDFMVRYCHPDDADFLYRCIAQGVAGPSTMSCEIRMKLASDEYKWYGVVLNKQNPRYLMLLALNMNDTKKQISLMRELAETISLTLSLGKVILWFFEDTHSLSGVVTQNHLARGTVFFNWSTVLYNIPEEYRQIMTDAITGAIVNGQNFHIEIPIWLDALRWVSVTAIVTGETQCPLMGVSVDITALKEMEEELQAQKLTAEKAMAAKTRFLANMSHEVRTPLNGMCGLMAVLERTEMSDDVRDMIKVMSDAFQRLMELLSDTLDLAKIEQDKMAIVHMSFCPIVLAEDIICTLAQKADPAIEINIHTNPRSGYKYYGDPYVFSRVLGNLVSNSVKFTSKGSIDIYMKESNNGLLIKVKDTGIGISEERKQAVFEYFEQGDNSATRKYGGIGVGLTLIKKLTDLAKGTMTMESQLNVGTEFTVYLPFEPIYYHYIPKTQNPHNPQLLYLADTNTHVYHEVQKYAEFSTVELIHDTSNMTHLTSVVTDMEHLDIARSINMDIPKVVLHPDKIKIPGFEVFPRPYFVDTIFNYCYCEYKRKKLNRDTELDWEKVSILAVDDNQTNRMVLAKLLANFKCKFQIAETGMQTLDLFEHNHFDLVLVDYYLPDINGPEVAKRISQKSSVPIVAMTASTDRSDLANCRDSGMKYLIEKPLTIRNMKRVLKEAIMESSYQ